MAANKNVFFSSFFNLDFTNSSRVIDPSLGSSLTKRNSLHEHAQNFVNGGQNRQNSPGRPMYMADPPQSRGNIIEKKKWRPT